MTRRAALAALIFAGTAWDAWHYIGAGAVVLAAASSITAAYVLDRVASVITWRAAVRATVALGVVALALFAISYPRLNVSERSRGGSDRDDDADIAVRAAFRGEYPWRPRTYLGNHVTHMPGSLIVAAPFVAAGGSALENLAVLPLAVWALGRRTRSAGALVTMVGGLAACTVNWHELVTGGNTLAEWALLSMAAVWFADNVSRHARAAVFGFLLNIRVNAMPAAASAVGVAARKTWFAALRSAVVIGAVQVALVAPFVVRGLHRFTPLASASPKFAHYDALVAHGSTVVPAAAALAGGLAGVVVARSLNTTAPVAVLAGLATSQLTQFGLMVIASLAAGSVGWAQNWSGYLALGVIPGLAALALSSPTSEKALNVGT